MRHLSLIILCALGAPLSAQERIPLRTLGPILATSTENVGPAVSVRATSNGRVLVAAGARQRVYAFDSTLRSFTMVADSGDGTGSTAFKTLGLIPYSGDSTLLPDLGSGVLLVVDGTGKQARSMAPPHASDIKFLGVPASYGRPAIDAKGRLIYRTMIPSRTQVPSDTAPIVRGDFDTRTVDTLAWIRAPVPGRVDVERKENPSGGPAITVVRMALNPFPMADEWAMLADGTIAIVRVHDYHIDWIDPDGTRRASPKMPFDWRRVTDAEKQQRADSARRAAGESFGKMAGVTGKDGSQIQIRTSISIVPDSELPTFWPPIQPGSVLADLDNHLWILPTTSSTSGNGFTYDVVDRLGRVIERVQLPPGTVLAGFGLHGDVYLTKAVGDATYLVRASLR